MRRDWERMRNGLEKAENDTPMAPRNDTSANEVLARPSADGIDCEKQRKGGFPCPALPHSSPWFSWAILTTPR